MPADYRPAICSLAYRPDGTSLFAAGGPHDSRHEGHYAARWSLFRRLWIFWVIAFCRICLIGRIHFLTLNYWCINMAHLSPHSTASILTTPSFILCIVPTLKLFNFFSLREDSKMYIPEMSDSKPVASYNGSMNYIAWLFGLIPILNISDCC